ncbi:hypothetical protein QBC35DRAFT_468752 [Podospora australis]|uniref:Uncharacterized protein n=1 Tax=Podospora australis TaxID=1536484 RepID=A0AAN7AM77_9PEZI|nr:hypothetical protein QBC35DRAFT_468752 [Podospora australis]
MAYGIWNDNVSTPGKRQPLLEKLQLLLKSPVIAARSTATSDSTLTPNPKSLCRLLTTAMHSPTIIQLALVLISGVWALVLPRPPPQNRTFFDTWGRVYPKRLCPWEMVDFCCDSLDWSGPQVKCVGAGNSRTRSCLQPATMQRLQTTTDVLLLPARTNTAKSPTVLVDSSNDSASSLLIRPGPLVVQVLVVLGTPSQPDVGLSF